MGKGGRKGKKGVYIEEKTDITNRLIHQDGAIQSKKKKERKEKDGYYSASLFSTSPI